MADKQGRDPAVKIEPGMVVEANEGDLGEEDLTKPKVKEVIRDTDGNVEKLIVKKGLIFQKEIEVTPDRVEQVVDKNATTEPTSSSAKDKATNKEGKIVIAASEAETEALSSIGSESLDRHSGAVLDEIEHAIPTTEGLRKLERQTAAQSKTGDQPRSKTALPN